MTFLQSRRPGSDSLEQPERQAGPMSSVSPKPGRPYIVVNAGSAGTSPDRRDHVLAHALPMRR
jgi:glucose dehydrogenase